MAEPAKRIATYEDVLAAPENMTAEILNGELWLSPRPASKHGLAEVRIASDLDGSFARGRPPGGWWIFVEPELHLGVPEPNSVVVVPDLAGWRRERMPEIPDVPAFTLPPDWVCEILSEGSRARRRDRVLKPDIYASCGVSHLWIVDPVGKTLEVYRLAGDVYLRIAAFAGDACVRAEPFDAVELDMSGWWVHGGEEE